MAKEKQPSGPPMDLGNTLGAGNTSSVSIEQAILKWADLRQQEQAHIIDKLERELEQTEAAAHRKRIEHHIDAAKRRIARRETFRAFDGANYQCPDCWMFQECWSIVRAIPTPDSENVLRCAVCDGEVIDRVIE